MNTQQEIDDLKARLQNLERKRQNAELQLDAMAGLGAADCSAAGRILKARELEISPCELAQIRRFVETHHYSHNLNGVKISHCFRVEYEGKLVGGVHPEGVSAGSDLFQPSGEGEVRSPGRSATNHNLLSHWKMQKRVWKRRLESLKKKKQNVLKENALQN